MSLRVMQAALSVSLRAAACGCAAPSCSRRSRRTRPFSTYRGRHVRFAVGDGLPARIGPLTNGARDRKTRADSGWSTSPTARSSAVAGVAARGRVEPGRPARRRRSRLSPAISAVYLTYAEPSAERRQRPGAGSGASWFAMRPRRV